MSTAVLFCETCDAHTPMSVHDVPEEAVRIVTNTARELGWRQLPEAPPQRFRARWLCSACVREICGPLRNRAREALHALLERISAVQRELAAFDCNHPSEVRYGDREHGTTFCGVCHADVTELAARSEVTP